jgi:hypothetical protein
MLASPGQYSECTGFFRFPGQYQSVKSVESPIQQTKEEILNSILKHPTEQSCTKQTKTNEKEEKAAALHAAILTNQPQVSRPRSQLTIPGSTQELLTQNVLPPPLHLHNLRPLNLLPQTHNRMPARLNRARPTPLDRLRHRHAPLPKLETREALSALPGSEGGVDEPHPSRANDQVRRREVACFVRHAGSRERFLGSQGG